RVERRGSSVERGAPKQRNEMAGTRVSAISFYPYSLLSTLNSLHSNAQPELTQQLFEAQPFSLVVPRRVVRLGPQSMKESVGFLHRIHRDSCAASDVAHTELLFIVLPTTEKQDTSRIDVF